MVRIVWITLVSVALCALSLAPSGPAHAQPAREPIVEPALVPPPPVEAARVDLPTSSVDVTQVLRGEGRGLTADEVAERAVANAPSVARAEAVARQARAGADLAFNGFIPQLALSFRYTRLSPIQNGSISTGPSIDPAIIPALVSGVDDPDARFLWEQSLTAQAERGNFTFPVVLDNYAFRASLSVPLSDIILSVLPSYEGAQANAEAAALRTLAQQADVRLSARQAFYDYAAARGSLAVARTALEQVESRHRQVSAFVEAGTSAAVDELRLRAQVAAAQVSVARALSGVEVSATALRILLRVDGSTPLAVGEDVLEPLPPLSESQEQLVEQALQERNDLRSARLVIRSAGRRVDAAEGSRYPHIAVSGNLDIANPNQRVFPATEEFRESWDVSAIVSWSPHDLLNGERQADEARAMRDQARADLQAMEDGVRLQVIQAATNYQAARLALESAQVGVEAADESYRVQSERFQAGASTVSDVIDASAEQVRAQLDLISAAIGARVGRAQLARAVGDGGAAAR